MSLHPANPILSNSVGLTVSLTVTLLSACSMDPASQTKSPETPGPGVHVSHVNAHWNLGLVEDNLYAELQIHNVRKAGSYQANKSQCGDAEISLVLQREESALYDNLRFYKVENSEEQKHICDIETAIEGSPDNTLPPGWTTVDHKSEHDDLDLGDLNPKDWVKAFENLATHLSENHDAIAIGNARFHLGVLANNLARAYGNESRTDNMVLQETSQHIEIRKALTQSDAIGAGYNHDYDGHYWSDWPNAEKILIAVPNHSGRGHDAFYSNE